MKYYVTTDKNGIHLRVRPIWSHLRAQNQQPDMDEQNWASIPHEMEVIRRMWQIHMEKDQRLENHMKDLWKDLNLNVVPLSKRTSEEVT